MKEITRIHIAKTSYDIEVVAKKDLEKYIDKLELYTADENLLEDIEIRMTEILALHGIEKNGIITAEEVKAIREQLGDPKEFISEDSQIEDTLSEDEEKSPRRLYRDTGSAVLAGVLSGIAKYLNVNPIWTRLIFLVILLMSFGTAFIVYLVLWLVIPPVRTAAEKLQLSGKPVTLASIKELHEQETENELINSPTSKTIKNILIYGLGTFAALGSVIAMVFTVWSGVIIGFDINTGALINEIAPNGFAAWMAYVMFVISGLLLSSLFAIIAMSLFRKKITKRIGISIVAIVLSGITIFSTGVGTILYSQWQEQSSLNNSRFTNTVDLPTQFNSIKNLTVDTGESSTWSNARVEYIVSPGKPYYEITLNALTKNISPIIKYSNDSKTAHLELDNVAENGNVYHYNAPLIKIYGPELDQITAKFTSTKYYNPIAQNNLTITADNSSFDLEGSYKNVSVQTIDAHSVALNNATIENLIADISGGHISAGVIRSLIVNQADICPENSDRSNRLVISAVSSNKMTYNGIEQNARTLESFCGGLVIGN